MSCRDGHSEKPLTYYDYPVEYRLKHEYKTRYTRQENYDNRSILKLSALGLLAFSVRLLRFRADFTIHEIAISIVHQPSVLFQPRLEKFFALWS